MVKGGVLMTSTLLVMNRVSGAEQVEWDTEVPASVSAAKAAFEKAKDAGFWAYREEEAGSGSGTSGTVVQDFDETAPKIVMNPQMVGG
jgi:hypothetical protein